MTLEHCSLLGKPPRPLFRFAPSATETFSTLFLGVESTPALKARTQSLPRSARADRPLRMLRGPDRLEESHDASEDAHCLRLLPFAFIVLPLTKFVLTSHQKRSQRCLRGALLDACLPPLFRHPVRRALPSSSLRSKTAAGVRVGSEEASGGRVRAEHRLKGDHEHREVEKALLSAIFRATNSILKLFAPFSSQRR